MLSSVLRSKRAVQVNVKIMRTFVRLSGQAPDLTVACCLVPDACLSCLAPQAYSMHDHGFCPDTITAVFPITIRCDSRRLPLA
jgi:hypothetical protein